MANKKVPQDIIELEHYFSRYFDAHIAPLADKAVKDADAAYLKEYQQMVGNSGALGATTFSGPMAGSAFARSQCLDSYKYYWSNIQKSFQKRFDASADFKADFGRLIDAYQKAMIDKMGKDQYLAESKKYGQDLATWYVNNRLLEKSLNRMASHGAPKDSIEYLLQKGTQLSLFGLAQPSDWEGMKALQEKIYNPSKTEKIAAYGVGGLMDFAIMPVGGMKTAIIGTAAGAGVDIMFSSGKQQQSVDSLVSHSLFGNNWSLPEARKTLVDAKDSTFLNSLNNGMKKKVELRNPSSVIKQIEQDRYPMKRAFFAQEERSEDIPSVIAPGMEESYKKEQEKMRQAAQKPAKAPRKEETPVANTSDQAYSYQPAASVGTQQYYQQNTNYQPTMANTNGWGGFLDHFGLSGFSDVFKNLGYVLAMLPDMMIGMFTGKTKSLSVQNNLMPIAAIVMGMFVRNPLLKMLLIGLGGANLLNKGTHEILGESVRSKQPQYRRYADEALNARLSHPQLNGNLLVVSIDGVPSTVTLQNHVVDAYRKGALPLNTLANAVLAKYDEQRQQIEQLYDRQQSQAEEQNQQLAIK
jgi:hypothetical protein